MEDNDQLHAATNRTQGPDPLEAEQAPERASIFWGWGEEGGGGIFHLSGIELDSSAVKPAVSSQCRRNFSTPRSGNTMPTVSTEPQP